MPLPDSLGVLTGVLKSLLVCFMLLQGLLIALLICFMPLHSGLGALTGALKSLLVCFMLPRDGLSMPRGHLKQMIIGSMLP